MVRSQNVLNPGSMAGQSIPSAETPANATRNRADARTLGPMPVHHRRLSAGGVDRTRGRYVASIGASSAGANLVKVARASVAPRAAGRARTSRVATSSIATRVSLEFDWRAKAVYG